MFGLYMECLFKISNSILYRTKVCMHMKSVHIVYTIIHLFLHKKFRDKNFHVKNILYDVQVLEYFDLLQKFCVRNFHLVFAYKNYFIKQITLHS